MIHFGITDASCIHPPCPPLEAGGCSDSVVEEGVLVLKLENFDALNLSLALPESDHVLGRNGGHESPKRSTTHAPPGAWRLFWPSASSVLPGLGMPLRKVQRYRYKGIICDKCGVRGDAVQGAPRAHGPYQLASPVSHVWYIQRASPAGWLAPRHVTTQLEKILTSPTTS